MIAFLVAAAIHASQTYNYEGCNSTRFNHFMDREWDRYTPADFACMERGKCGPKGVRFWDDGGPVCNREGWNGRRYRRAS
jgi:hypothetical protein